MKIASAQIESKVGDLAGNLARHIEMIEVAGENAVELLVFPEMSLTGYCRERGRELAVEPSQPEILTLLKKAKKHSLTIVVGAPIRIQDELFIGSLILLPNGETEIYTKQFLHTGEEEWYASSFEHDPRLILGDEIISCAICADINHEQHARNAKNKLCTLYLPSIFYTRNGIAEGHELLATYASRYALNVLMSNYAGEVGGMKAGGKSAFWDKKGKLVAELDAETPGLLILEKAGDNWSSKKYIKKRNALQRMD